MASLKALKIRIGSVKSTQKITKAMKMVAAAKLRRAQDAAQNGRPYAERLERVMASLATRAGGPGASPLLAGTGKDQVHLLVVATSERGLAGAFNSNIVRAARRKAEDLSAQGKTVRFYIAGKKGRVLKRFFPDAILADRDMSAMKVAGFDDAKAIADDLIARFTAGEFDVAHLFFSKFQSALAQVPTGIQIIPVPLAEQVVLKDAAPAAAAVTEYEPDEESILAELLPRNIAVQIFRALLENAASEQGSRMTAMDNATRNAGDMIKRLSIQYNRARQAAITTELVEIISGAEAL
ncbi:F-type H+-transporting ATPase subunit gamma [Sphingomonas sp. SORGH_AS802]|jgi:F-type H+-transporting ATPase subunit gamma|uniref:F0F1 ATP synthase subunit gamma n=1 Tax=unclassified Sphingomonas TaxID=196159 RepID=UPI000F7E9324|nr:MULTISPECIES: F0F1 ATP synthase subunit gamma [unclassified Sphingomonas]MDR6125458.1 F-type H+-transporting ATPase subunit gamma [Sphingomonas sp. SORGH_AS_0438]MDR6134074.1 F-type H+-transporting ATPase subunit gamma [Sphingomonas sp. SORGH_AS_0802]RSU47919.1 F0F1 ATP synthase subunit gamma [Sphingomonas sp. S-NIH.Pt15_0812]